MHSYQMGNPSIRDMKVAISRCLKRQPRVFDLARRATRLFGDPGPIYQSLANITERLPDVAFIQIGSNDGISVDPLREFIVAGPKWHGAFIEPVPQIFDLLRRNYSYLKGRRFAFFNAAVSDRTGAKPFYKVRDSCLSDLPPFAYQIGSFDRSHVTKHLAVPDVETRLEVLQVPCKTYDEIVLEAGLPRVDVLHMDVEGHEHSILKSIDFSRHRPRLILFEISHMTPAQKEDVSRFLGEYGYELRDYGIDCLASLPDM